MKDLYETSLLSIAEKPVDIVWHPNSDKIAVIIDPRYDKIMVCVIKNFMQYLNPLGWNLIIITHKKDAVDFPGTKVIELNEKNIYYKDDKPNITLKTYNEILMAKEFWNFIPGEHILIFQKDCYMYKMFDEALYLDYAFCGANCVWQSENKEIYGFAINGGCSLRRKSEMLDCLQKISWDIIEKYYPKLGVYNEDLFFTFACHLLNKSVPKKEERHKFAIETQKSTDIDTCFYHGWDKNYQTEEQAQKMLDLVL